MCHSGKAGWQNKLCICLGVGLDQENSILPVSISGAYWTGAGAVINLLEEHPAFVVVPGEFTLFSFGQFFQEVFSPLAAGTFPEKALVNHVRRMRDFDRPDLFPIRVVGRKLCGSVGWYSEFFFGHRTNAAKIFGTAYAAASKDLVQCLAKSLRDSTAPVSEEVSAKIGTLLGEAAMGYGASIGKQNVEVGVFDQLVSPPYHDDAIRALPDMKFINVHRDWRDQYVEVRTLLKTMMVRNASLGVRPWDERFDARNMDHMDVFVSMRQHVDGVIEAQKQKEKSQVKWIEFEDLIKDTKKVAREIFDFLEVDHTRWQPEQKLFPAKSARGIGKWQSPNWQTDELKAEFSMISERLSR